MESLPTDGFLKYHPDTLKYVRQQYNLDKPGEIDRAIDVLEAWLLKQNHFAVKTFPRDYLERQIILDKGSVERAKKQLDNLFTMKTIVTSFHEKYDVKKDLPDLRDMYIGSMLPRLTQDHNRVYAAIVNKNGITTELLHQAYSMGCLNIEYERKYEYCNGLQAIFDFRSVNIIDFIPAINVSYLRQFIRYIMVGYQMRLKGLHLMTNSKTIDVFISILKPMFSKKIQQRIHVHMTDESLHKHVEKEVLPKELGGYERSLATLTDDLYEELGKKENVEHFTQMGKALVVESLRLGDKITKDDILGISGSFRTISID